MPITIPAGGVNGLPLHPGFYLILSRSPHATGRHAGWHVFMQTSRYSDAQRLAALLRRDGILAVVRKVEEPEC